MLKRVKKQLVGTFEVKGTIFLVDIVHGEEPGVLEAWLYAKQYGVKEFMFGASEELAVMLDLVEGNLPSYIRGYADEHMEGDDWDEYLGFWYDEPNVIVRAYDEDEESYDVECKTLEEARAVVEETRAKNLGLVSYNIFANGVCVDTGKF